MEFFERVVMGLHLGGTHKVSCKKLGYPEVVLVVASAML
jgi:hypothetical protein